MSSLPVISESQCIKALQQVGFVIRRRKGSHVIMQQADPYAMVVVPDHKTLKRGTLQGIIRDAGLSVDEFIELLS